MPLISNRKKFQTNLKVIAWQHDCLISNWSNGTIVQKKDFLGRIKDTVIINFKKYLLIVLVSSLLDLNM